ncbi:UPF0481 protein-like protein [Tanacetum coccineum]|uniref:UPF0481 protein-like protein n=1 Tax=Tanacetum coccineum TaxID=301880 RepID=A0ABQ5A912_9ASTR
MANIAPVDDPDIYESIKVLVDQDMNPFGTDLPLDNVEDNNDHDHILGLFQKCYWDSHAMPSVNSKTPLKSAEEFSKTISYTVTELALAGVKFKPNRDPKRVLEMKFKSSSVTCFCWSWCKARLLECLSWSLKITQSQSVYRIGRKDESVNMYKEPIVIVGPGNEKHASRKHNQQERLLKDLMLSAETKHL